MSEESALTMPEGSKPVTAEHRLKELGIALPAPPEPFGTYAEAVQTNNFRTRGHLRGNRSMIAPWPRNRLTSTLGIEVRHLSVAAATAGRSDLLPLWAGQSAGLSTCTDVSVFLQSLLEEASAIAGPISDWSAKYREHHPTA